MNEHSRQTLEVVPLHLVSEMIETRERNGSVTMRQHPYLQSYILTGFASRF